MKTRDIARMASRRTAVRIGLSPLSEAVRLLHEPPAGARA